MKGWTGRRDKSAHFVFSLIGQCEIQTAIKNTLRPSGTCDERDRLVGVIKVLIKFTMSLP